MLKVLVNAGLQERREIEAALLRGELWGVAATNAMELGVDIGSLDVTLHLGFPGSIASLWQQVGFQGFRGLPPLRFAAASNMLALHRGSICMFCPPLTPISTRLSITRLSITNPFAEQLVELIVQRLLSLLSQGGAGAQRCPEAMLLLAALCPLAPVLTEKQRNPCLC